MDIFLYDNNKNIIGTVNSNNLISYTQDQELNGLIQADLTGVYSPELEDAVYFGSQDIDDSSIFWRYKITTFDKNNSLFTMSGVYELFDDLQGQNIIKDKRPTNQGVSMALNALLDGTDWEVGKIESDSIATSNWYYISALGAFWDFLEKWKVEYKPRMVFDKGKVVGKFIDIKDSISGDYGKWYEYGDKLVSIVAEKSVNSVYTAFYGRGKGEEIIDENGQKTGGYGRKITFADVEWLESEGDPLDKPLGQEYLEFPNATKRFGYDNQRPRYKIVDFSDIEDKEELLKATYEYGLNEIRPKLQLKADVIEGELVELGETSTIIRPDIDIKYKTRIFKIKKDFLNRNIKTIELGDKIIQSRTEYMNNITNEIMKVQDENLSYIERIQKQLTNAMLNSDGYNYNLLPDNIYGLPSGLYSFDAPIDKDPTKVIYFGAGMIAIANSKNPDGSWNFRTFGTGDGFTADQLITGIIRGGKSFWNLETGELNIGDMFLIDPNGNASLSQQAKEELKGEPGRTPSININSDGFWIIDGTNTNVKAEGIDGHTPKLEISSDGYWVIDGNKSDTHAEAYLLNIVYYPGEENPLNVNDISLITLSPNSDTRWIGINNSRRDKYQDWENKSLDMFDWSKFVGSNGSDAIIVSDVEPSDKTKIWRKSITDPNLYIYVDGKWVEVDAQLQDIVVQIQEEISGQEDKWQGDINTNIENVINELTNFQSDLKNITDELEGKANVEQVLNEEEIKKTVEDIISKYPEIINLNQHFNFSQEGLRITATDASNKEVDTSVLIKNDGLEIEVEGQAAAYFKQNETLTPNLNVEGTAWVGNHAMLGFNGYDADGSYNENKNITVFAWSPRKKEEDS